MITYNKNVATKASSLKETKKNPKLESTRKLYYYSFTFVYILQTSRKKSKYTKPFISNS